MQELSEKTELTNPSEEDSQPISGEVIESPPAVAAQTPIEEALTKAKAQGTALMFFGGVCIFLGASFLFGGGVGFNIFAPILWVIGLSLIMLGIQVRKKPFIKIYLYQGILTLAVGLVFLLPVNRSKNSGDLFDLILGAMAAAQGGLWIKEYLRIRHLS